MSTFTPHYFVSVGETAAYYTLRCTYSHSSYKDEKGNEIHRVMNYHVKNLSQDIDEAFVKAMYASLLNGIPCIDNKENVEREMREIKRSNKEEMEKRALALAEQQAEYERQAASIFASNLHDLRQGIVSFGRYRGYKITDIPVGYLNWVMNNKDQFNIGDIMWHFADELLTKYSHLKFHVPTSKEFYGQVKDKVNLVLKVVRVGGFVRNNYMGTGTEYVHVITMVDENDHCFVSMNTKFKANMGEELEIKAIISKHETYKGQAQTFLTHIKQIDKVST